jgi:aminoglycoside/choline kinase family phosphotransferase
MALFPEWFCARHLRLDMNDKTVDAVQSICDALAREALQQPRVFVHRDYHSRNLMVTDGARHGANPGILDFQDAVYGPVTYDLVSLLRDSYIAWPATRVLGWISRFREEAAQAGVAVGASEAQFVRWFDWMGVQRQLKVLGIFARLWHRDGKPGYLKDLPRTLDYVREVAGRYAELAPLRELIDSQVLPVLEQRTAEALQR